MKRHHLGSFLALLFVALLLTSSALPRIWQAPANGPRAVANPQLVSQLTTPAALPQDSDALAAAWQRAKAVGSYRFLSDITQTLIPRAVPETVGQQETALTFQLDGAVQLPDSAYLEMRVAANGANIPALMLLRQDGQTYAQQNGKLAPTQDPTGVVLPEADVLGYLGAAENVQALESVTVGDQTITRLGFGVSGVTLAERARAHAQELLSARSDVPEGVTLSPSPVLQRLTGRGELWVDAAGYPVRQVLDLQIPALSDVYDARLHLVVDLRDYGKVEALPRAVQGADGSWTLQGALSVGDQVAAAGAATASGIVGSVAVASAAAAQEKAFLVRVSPSAVGLFLLIVIALVLIRLYRTQPKRAYTLIASVMVVLMIAGPSLQAGRVVNFVERNVQAAVAEAATGDEALQALGLAPGNVASRPAPELDMSLDETANQAASVRSQVPAVRLQTSSGSESEYIERCLRFFPAATSAPLRCPRSR